MTNINFKLPPPPPPPPIPPLPKQQRISPPPSIQLQSHQPSQKTIRDRINRFGGRNQQDNHNNQKNDHQYHQDGQRYERGNRGQRRMGNEEHQEQPFDDRRRGKPRGRGRGNDNYEHRRIDNNSHHSSNRNEWQSKSRDNSSRERDFSSKQRDFSSKERDNRDKSNERDQPQRYNNNNRKYQGDDARPNQRGRGNTYQAAQGRAKPFVKPPYHKQRNQNKASSEQEPTDNQQSEVSQPEDESQPQTDSANINLDDMDDVCQQGSQNDDGKSQPISGETPTGKPQPQIDQMGSYGDLTLIREDEMCSRQQFNQLVEKGSYFPSFEISKRTGKPQYTLCMKQHRRSSNHDALIVSKISLIGLKKGIDHANKFLIDADHMVLNDLPFSVPPKGGQIEFKSIHQYLVNRFRQMIGQLLALPQKDKGKPEFIQVAEQIARFLALCVYQVRKCENEQCVIDFKYTQECITRCLSLIKDFNKQARLQLMALIRKKRADGQEPTVADIRSEMKKANIFISPNEPEMAAFQLIYDSDKSFFLNYSLAASTLSLSPDNDPIFATTEFKTALQFANSYNQDAGFCNYIRLQKLIASPETDLLLSCIMLLHISSIRKTTWSLLKRQGNSLNQKAPEKHRFQEAIGLKGLPEEAVDSILKELGCMVQNGRIVSGPDGPCEASADKPIYLQHYSIDAERFLRNGFYKDSQVLQLKKKVLQPNLITREELLTRNWRPTAQGQDYVDRLIAHYLGAIEQQIDAEDEEQEIVDRLSTNPLGTRLPSRHQLELQSERASASVPERSNLNELQESRKILKMSKALDFLESVCIPPEPKQAPTVELTMNDAFATFQKHKETQEKKKFEQEASLLESLFGRMENYCEMVEQFGKGLNKHSYQFRVAPKKLPGKMSEILNSVHKPESQTLIQHFLSICSQYNFASLQMSIGILFIGANSKENLSMVSQLLFGTPIQLAPYGQCMEIDIQEQIRGQNKQNTQQVKLKWRVLCLQSVNEANSVIQEVWKNDANLVIDMHSQMNALGSMLSLMTKVPKTIRSQRAVGEREAMLKPLFIIGKPSDKHMNELGFQYNDFFTFLDCVNFKTIHREQQLLRLALSVFLNETVRYSCSPQNSAKLLECVSIKKLLHQISKTMTFAEARVSKLIDENKIITEVQPNGSSVHTDFNVLETQEFLVTVHALQEYVTICLDTLLKNIECVYATAINYPAWPNELGEALGFSPKPVNSNEKNKTHDESKSSVDILKETENQLEFLTKTIRNLKPALTSPNDSQLNQSLSYASKTSTSFPLILYERSLAYIDKFSAMFSDTSQISRLLLGYGPNLPKKSTANASSIACKLITHLLHRVSQFLSDIYVVLPRGFRFRVNEKVWKQRWDTSNLNRAKSKKTHDSLRAAEINASRNQYQNSSLNTNSQSTNSGTISSGNSANNNTTPYFNIPIVVSASNNPIAAETTKNDAKETGKRPFIYERLDFLENIKKRIKVEYGPEE